MESDGRPAVAPARGSGLSPALVRVMAVATGVAVANNYYAQPLLPRIQQALGLSSSVTGLVVTFSQLGYAAGLVFLLPLGDLVERRRLIVGLSLLAAAGLLWESLATSAGMLLAAALLVGVAVVLAQVLVPLAASMAREEERGRVVGTIMSGLLLGILLARTAAGYISEWFGWRAVFGVASGAMLVLALVLRRSLPVDRQAAPLTYPALLRSVLQLLREEPVVRLRCVYGAASFGAFSVLWTSLAFLLAGPAYHFSEGTIGLFGLIGAAGAAAALVAGRLADRGLQHPMTGLTALGLLLSYLLIGFGARSLVALVGGIVLLDFAAQALHITNQSEIYRLRPEARSRINSAYMTAYFLGGTLGSAASAVVHGAFGWLGVSVLGAAFGAGALLLWLAQSRFLLPKPQAA